LSLDVVPCSKKGRGKKGGGKGAAGKAKEGTTEKGGGGEGKSPDANARNEEEGRPAAEIEDI